MNKVTNMRSINGNPIPNQFILHTDRGVCFKSYESVIARVFDGKVELDLKYWNYSVTTSKYRNLFLGETSKETAAKIKSGEYTLTDLN